MRERTVGSAGLRDKTLVNFTLPSYPMTTAFSTTNPNETPNESPAFPLFASPASERTQNEAPSPVQSTWSPQHLAFSGRKSGSLELFLGSTNRELRLLHTDFSSTPGSNLEMFFTSEIPTMDGSLLCHGHDIRLIVEYPNQPVDESPFATQPRLVDRSLDESQAPNQIYSTLSLRI